MDNQPSSQRELLVPILISALSLIGIIVILLIGRAQNAPAQVAMTPSNTPFQFLFLGTEPAASTIFPGGSEIVPTVNEQDEVDTPLDVTPSFATPTRSSSVSTPLILGTPIAPGAPNEGEGPPGAGAPNATQQGGTITPGIIYDDTDPRLQYGGNWISQTNVAGAHEGTLHVSTTRGDTVTFTFTGSEIHFFYDAGPSLGSVAVTIDGLGSPPFSQTQGNKWESGPLTPGTHSIVIEHFDGGAVNIDSLMIPAATPTSTTTPSVTSTPTP